MATVGTPRSAVTPAQVRSAGTMCELFQATAAARGDELALRTPDDRVRLSWRRYAERVRAIAAGLAALGVGRGDTVALMLTNRPEFHLVDAAVFHLGATPFSVYNTSAAEQIGYLFGNAGNRVVVCERRFLSRLESALAGRTVICVDDPPEGLLSLADVERAGAPDFDFEAAWRSVGPDDVLTLIYTSGTTGPPKGVELTHRNVLFSAAAGVDVIGGADVGRVVSYLPDAHLANRWFTHYLAMVTGAAITTVEDPKLLVEALPAVRPTIFLAVPALWYKVKAALEQAVERQPGPRRRLARWAIRLGQRRVALSGGGTPPAASLRLRHALAERLVLAPLRRRIGLDQLTIAVSGAAPIAPEALRFVLALGIPVCEGWGMSESTAVATVNRPGEIRVGTVGRPMRGVEVMLAADGELLIRGENVMKGYRGDPARTAEAVDPAGWLRTGDIGTVDTDGYVRIVDRKKELIINAAGKNMSPANIESHLKAASPLIGQAIAIGDRRPYNVALIVLDPDFAPVWAQQNGLEGKPIEELAGEQGLTAAVQAGVDEANAKLSRVEQIKKFKVLPTEWAPGGDELTPTMKLKRKPIAEKYAGEIDALYAD